MTVWPWTGRSVRLSVRVLDRGETAGGGRLPAAAGLGGRFALSGRWNGGGAIYGADPLVTVVDGGDPFATLDARPQVDTGSVDPAVAVRAVGGAWVGWFGFAAGRPAGFDPTVSARSPSGGLPTSYLGFHPNVVRYDAASGRWTDEALVGIVGDAELDRRRRSLVAAVLGPDGDTRPTGPARIDRFGSATDRAGHRAAVRRCLHHIRAGDIYQVNLCLQLVGRIEGRADDLYERLVAALRPAHGAFIETPGARPVAVISLSPELFLRRSGRQVWSSPIKGTRPRPADAAHARVQAERLTASAKDRAENVMITDLIRNDLSRVAETGTVTVPALLRLEAHPGVWHLVSDVAARLGADVGDADLLRATFPPGSVTGAPKIRALGVIAEVEPVPRGVYTGAIGFVSPVAGLELSVAIRTLEVAGERVTLGVGGGITVASDPAEEWWECFDKAAAIAAAAGAEITVAGARRPAAGAGRADPTTQTKAP